MKIFLSNLIFISNIFFSFSQVGIATDNPQNNLDVNGWVKIGNQNDVTPSEGAIRFNETNNNLELYNGVNWSTVGEPKTQRFTLRDGIDETVTTNTANFINAFNSGFGTPFDFTIENVLPNSNILFLVEISGNNNLRSNWDFNSQYKIYGNGVNILNIDIPSTGTNNTYNYFHWGTTNNADIQNLTFSFENNVGFHNLVITTIIF